LVKGREENRLQSTTDYYGKMLSLKSWICTDILTKGNRVVILGYFESRYKANNKLKQLEFSIDVVVKNGLITRYHVLEDSFAASITVKP
jgi:hypothetical protein